MKLDLASFAFGANILKGSGTSPWGTSLGQSQPDYKFTAEGYENILSGMVYNSVPLKSMGMPIGKGGNVVYGNEYDGIQLAAVFKKVYVNEELIKAPFALVVLKENSTSHNGRRHLKYSPKIFFKYEDDFVFSNNDFLEQVRAQLDLADNACWFVSEMEVKNLDELHLTAIIIDPNNSRTYADSKERATEWHKLAEQSVE